MQTRLKRNRYKALAERDGLICGICKKSIEKEYRDYEDWLSWKDIKGPKPKQPHKRSSAGLTIDHIYPVSLARKDGWTHGKIWKMSNIQLAHKQCNEDKGQSIHEKKKDLRENTSRMGLLLRVWKNVWLR